VIGIGGVGRGVWGCHVADMVVGGSRVAGAKCRGVALWGRVERIGALLGFVCFF
jgi:hypothetical protein